MMTIENDHRLYDLPDEDRRRLTEILTKIENLAGDEGKEGLWRDQLQRLKERVRQPGPLPSKEERLLLYQAVREAEAIPPEAAFFLIAYTVEWIVEERMMTEFHKRLKAAEKAGSTKEYQKLIDDEQPLREHIMVDTFRKYNEPEMADLYENDRTRFEQIKAAGRDYFSQSPDQGPLQ